MFRGKRSIIREQEKMSNILNIDGSRFSKTTRLSDMTFETSLNIKTIQYETANGFVPIDQRILRRAEGNFWGVNDASLKVRIAPQTRQVSGHDVTLVNQIDNSLLGFSLEHANKSTAIRLEENTIVFPNVFQDIDWHLTSHPDSFKSTVVIKTAKSTHVKQRKGRLKATFSFKMEQTGKGIRIKTFRAFDAINSHVPLKITQTKNRIVCTADVTDSIFPVYVDPTAYLGFEDDQDDMGHVHKYWHVWWGWAYEYILDWTSPTCSYTPVAGRGTYVDENRMMLEFDIKNHPYPYKSIETTVLYYHPLTCYNGGGIPIGNIDWRRYAPGATGSGARSGSPQATYNAISNSTDIYYSGPGPISTADQTRDLGSDACDDLHDIIDTYRQNPYSPLTDRFNLACMTTDFLLRSWTCGNFGSPGDDYSPPSLITTWIRRNTGVV